MPALLKRLKNRIRRLRVHGAANKRLRSMEERIRAVQPAPRGQPVALFNASTRLEGLSLNAGFQAVTAWALRMSGVPVRHFACQAGLSRCVLGTAHLGPDELPPCAGCIVQSRGVYPPGQTTWFTAGRYPELENQLRNLRPAELQAFSWERVPLGQLCLPALRWSLRRHNLLDDERTARLARHYIASAWHVHEQFDRLLRETQPRAVVVFNGMFYPEATARWLAERKYGLPVYSHEVGLRPMTAFFTSGDATAYPIRIPEGFQLSAVQEQKLDEYLSQRWQGNFSMAGVRFWPQMRPLSAELEQTIHNFDRLVPVFTNVIFDTSQPHSNVLFPDMFVWLDRVLELARAHPRTLFLIRAHPDEARPGKSAAESVAGWAAERGVSSLPNVRFIPPQEYISSYELIRRSQFVMIYNSTIGLEASLMGAAVLCAGKARFTQLPTVFFPASREEYNRMAQSWLSQPEPIQPPAEHRLQARRFLYYQLFRTSLPFSRWLEEDGIWNGYVRLRDLQPHDFAPAADPVLQALCSGILDGQPFVLEDQP